jgi:hypothetical protein
VTIFQLTNYLITCPDAWSTYLVLVLIWLAAIYGIVRFVFWSLPGDWIRSYLKTKLMILVGDKRRTEWEISKGAKFSELNRMAAEAELKKTGVQFTSNQEWTDYLIKFWNSNNVPTLSNKEIADRRKKIKISKYKKFVLDVMFWMFDCETCQSFWVVFFIISLFVRDVGFYDTVLTGSAAAGILNPVFAAVSKKGSSSRNNRDNDGSSCSSCKH